MPPRREPCLCLVPESRADLLPRDPPRAAQRVSQGAGCGPSALRVFAAGGSEQHLLVISESQRENSTEEAGGEAGQRRKLGYPVAIRIGAERSPHRSTPPHHYLRTQHEPSFCRPAPVPISAGFGWQVTTLRPRISAERPCLHSRCEAVQEVAHWWPVLSRELPTASTAGRIVTAESSRWTWHTLLAPAHATRGARVAPLRPPLGQPLA